MRRRLRLSTSGRPEQHNNGGCIQCSFCDRWYPASKLSAHVREAHAVHHTLSQHCRSSNAAATVIEICQATPTLRQRDDAVCIQAPHVMSCISTWVHILELTTTGHSTDHYMSDTVMWPDIRDAALPRSSPAWKVTRSGQRLLLSRTGVSGPSSIHYQQAATRALCQPTLQTVHLEVQGLWQGVCGPQRTVPPRLDSRDTTVCTVRRVRVIPTVCQNDHPQDVPRVSQKVREAPASCT